ncbi:hypothetical protein TREMEDRAFT_64225 [Tremella mesenterica DSM 1558]|uniref:uncharacterized protein n=1 Tax=Tremella mesenterica (strain ATCC 24925 / CBS 8224 / DSM 1558 / NBRC 9311 / NRRL Y-6157 / RJB 2259-6 / UBC 559-6) TaxID=578456 RepID=UPI0003F4A4E4|nr:uncharacterized protein TREMEDRAFT_64225 [Tremella mesenterica DSM 1558]EIW67631.1 hypothetical protein TREMEDRAFT_64225 [Tremella mesenterica DSM 1558]
MLLTTAQKDVEKALKRLIQLSRCLQEAKSDSKRWLEGLQDASQALADGAAREGGSVADNSGLKMKFLTQNVYGHMALLESCVPPTNEITPESATQLCQTLGSVEDLNGLDDDKEHPSAKEELYWKSLKQSLESKMMMTRACPMTIIVSQGWFFLRFLGPTANNFVGYDT